MTGDTLVWGFFILCALSLIGTTMKAWDDIKLKDDIRRHLKKG